MAIPICATLEAISEPPLVTTAATCAAIERAVKARLHQLPVLIFLTSVNSAFHSHRTFEDVEDRAAGARDVAPALRLLGRLADRREDVVEQADGVRHLRRRGHDGEHRGHAADDVEEDLPAPHQVGAERAFEAADLLRPVLGTAPDLNVRTRRNDPAALAARRSPLAARRSWAHARGRPTREAVVRGRQEPR